MSYIRAFPLLAICVVFPLSSGCGASFKTVAGESIGALGDAIDGGWEVESSRQKAQQRATIRPFYHDDELTRPREGVTQEDVFEALAPVRERHRNIREGWRVAIAAHRTLTAAYQHLRDGTGDVTMADVLHLLVEARAAYQTIRDAVGSDPDDPPDEGPPDPEE